MKRPIILDGRNCYKLDDMAKHELIYESIGRRIISNIQIPNKIDRVQSNMQ